MHQDAPQNITRRQWLARSGMGLGMLGLGDLLAQPAEAGAASSPLAGRPPHFAPRAKHIIHIFLNGGVSQVDTFDHKPLLEKYNRRPLPVQGYKTENRTGTAFASPFKFKRYGESGLAVSDAFANVGSVIDDVCVIRSMHTDSPTHTPCLMMMNSGSLTQIVPSIGSWLTYGLGSENQNLPGFVTLVPGGLPIGGVENWRSAFLPSIYQGTYVETEGKKPRHLIDNITNNYLGQCQQRRQLDFLQSINREHLNQRGEDDALESRIQSYEMAYRMQTEASDAFDIDQEPKYIHEMYGSSPQARQMIMARRLIERGVRYVQLWHGKEQPWDSHNNLTKNVKFTAGQCDQGIAALIRDLKQRGLFDETLIVWCGEFGRTPTVELDGEGNSRKGRDHNHFGFSACLAGGGVRGGMAYGATDDFGFKAVENPVHVHDLHATMLHLMGLDHERLTFRHAGRDFRLTDVHGRVIKDIVA